MKKADMLFLERNCPHCGVIKARLNMEAVTDDDFRGKDDQEFFVYSSQSNSASVEILKRFGLRGFTIPVLLRHDGTVLDKDKVIMEHLEEQGMFRPVEIGK